MTPPRRRWRLEVKINEAGKSDNLNRALKKYFKETRNRKKGTC
jgi:hypothetical protein